MEKKVCTKCGQTKPVTEYTWKDSEKRWRNARCKACVSAYVAEYYRTNERYREARKAASKLQVKTPEQNRKHSLKHMYGLTVEQYEAMRAAQGNCCALCRSPQPGRNNPAKKWKAGHWNVDHCHETGRVRGLLCHKCNARLGSYEGLLKDIGAPTLEAYLNER